MLTDDVADDKSFGIIRQFLGTSIVHETMQRLSASLPTTLPKYLH